MVRDVLCCVVLRCFPAAGTAKCKAVLELMVLSINPGGLFVGTTACKISNELSDMNYLYWIKECNTVKY